MITPVSSYLPLHESWGETLPAIFKFYAAIAVNCTLHFSVLKRHTVIAVAIAQMQNITASCVSALSSDGVLTPVTCRRHACFLCRLFKPEASGCECERVQRLASSVTSSLAAAAAASRRSPFIYSPLQQLNRDGARHGKAQSRLGTTDVIATFGVLRSFYSSRYSVPCVRSYKFPSKTRKSQRADTLMAVLVVVDFVWQTGDSCTVTLKARNPLSIHLTITSFVSALCTVRGADSNWEGRAGVMSSTSLFVAGEIVSY